MSIELKQAAQQALSALEKSQPHPANPVIGLTNQDFIDHEETIRQLRTAIQQAEAQQPAQSVNEKHLGDFELLVVTTAYEQGFGHAFRTELSNPYAPVTNAYKAWDMGRSAGKRKGQPQQSTMPNVDVRTILLAIVPGDGNGEEVYAESVDDVVAKMTELSEREESLRTQVDLLTAAVEARGREIAKLKATTAPVYQIRKAFTQDAEWAWRDATEALFHMHPKEHRRILYTHSAPSVPKDGG